MFEPEEFQPKANLLRRVAEALYGQPTMRTLIAVEELYRSLSEYDKVMVDSALKKMEGHDLLSLDFHGSQIQLLGPGKSIFEQNCIAEVVLGRDYISKKYRAAIVHIIVNHPRTGQTGGTGFFSADYPNFIITARHVLEGRTILKIEDNSGRQIPVESGRIHLAPAGLDLAAVQCNIPPGIEPIRVGWTSEALSLGAELIVFGYPKIAGHFPGLYQAKSELQAIPKKYQSRDSLIVSGVHPGCSGGPVLDYRGIAIGVVEQENQLQEEAASTTYFCATPAFYLKDFL